MIYFSLQKDLLFRSLAILLDILLLSLDKACIAHRLTSLVFSQWSTDPLTVEQGMVFSLVPGLCMHASLFLWFACPLHEESSQEDQGDIWTQMVWPSNSKVTLQGPNLTFSNVMISFK